MYLSENRIFGSRMPRWENRERKSEMQDDIVIKIGFLHVDEHAIVWGITDYMEI